MIRHIVLFKVREGVAKDDPRVGKALGALRRLGGRIQLIEEWEVGENFSPRPVAVDFSLLSSFATREDLSAYVEHSDHRDVVALLREVCTWQVCDFED